MVVRGLDLVVGFHDLGGFEQGTSSEALNGARNGFWSGFFFIVVVFQGRLFMGFWVVVGTSSVLHQSNVLTATSSSLLVTFFYVILKFDITSSFAYFYLS